MDLQTSLVYVGVVVISAAVILLVSMFGIKEKSYEEAIAEQRKLPDDLLLGKKDKGKEKKHKNKTGKKVKEKKEENKEEKEEKPDEKPEHVQFEETPQILPPDLPPQKENLTQQPAVEPPVNKSPKETPTKSSKKSQKPAQKKEISVVDAAPVPAAPVTVAVAATQNAAPVSVPVAAAVQPAQPVGKETSKKNKKKNDILTQIGNEKDGVDIALLMPLIQNAEWSRSEIQILVEQLLNKQQDNPVEHSEWSEGRSDPMIKLKKQLAEKDKALAEEHEASLTFQNRIKELRAEFNAERSRLTQQVKKLEEDLNNKITEAQTLQARKQHIFETHSAEKQRLVTQIEQLQAKVNEDASIIHKMQTEQGQAQSQLQKELNAQRQQLESQFVQMRETEKALQTQLAQKHHEVQELQSVNMTMTQELQATCESSTAEIDMLRGQLVMLQEQYMHAEGQLQHYKEAGDRLQEMARQLEESHRAQADLDHRLKSSLRHEQDLQKQIHALQNDLKIAKSEAGELSKVQNELLKLKNDLSHSQNEAKNEAAEITSLKNLLATKEEELNKAQNDFKNAQNEIKKLEAVIGDLKAELAKFKVDLQKSQEKEKTEVKSLQEKLLQAEEFVRNSKEATGKLKAELETFQNGGKKTTDVHLQMTKLQEENNRLVGRIDELQREAKVLKEGVAKENGVAEVNNVDAGLLKQKEAQIEGLRAELAKKTEEFERLREIVEGLKNDVKSQTGVRKQLEEDLEAQKSKNNESLEKIKLAEQESTKSLLQRIFPEVQVQEKSYDKWLTTFEKRISVILTAKTADESQPELEKENKNLQSMVSHYKKIIDDTEGMLNNLQSHVESEESRWQSELRLKEGEIANLRIELKELVNKSSVNDLLHEKISHLESRLAEEEAATRSQKTTGSLAELEQLQEEKQRLVQELENERSNRIQLDSEINKLQSRIEQSEAEVARLKSLSSGASSTPDQSSVNGPPSESSKPEGGSGKK